MIHQNKLSQLITLCKAHHVEACYLFGSAATNKMTAKSDIDILVRFSSSIAPINYADNYFDLAEKLTELLCVHVDLVSEKSLTNKVLIESINASKLKLYEAT